MKTNNNWQWYSNNVLCLPCCFTQHPYQLSLYFCVNNHCSLTAAEFLSACMPVFKQSLSLWSLYWESAGLSGTVCNFSRYACAILVVFPAGFKLMSWTNSIGRERKRHRQPWYPVEDHDTLEADRFYSLDGIQHCIKVKDLNVSYKAIEDRDQNTDSLPGTCPCNASTDPMAKLSRNKWLLP